MSTHTAPKIEEMLSSVIHVAQLTCEQLCEEEANDFDILDSLDEFPVKMRAHVEQVILRNLAGIRMALKQKKCPAC